MNDKREDREKLPDPDEVLRKMLNTPPDPKKAKPKPEPPPESKRKKKPAK